MLCDSLHLLQEMGSKHLSNRIRILILTHQDFFYIYYFSTGLTNKLQFPFEVSKLTSVKNKLNLLMKYWFVVAKIVFFACHGPKKGSKYHLETVQTTFSDNDNYYREIFVKINFFHAWKCIIADVKYRSKFWCLRRKPAVMFSKWVFF